MCFGFYFWGFFTMGLLVVVPAELFGVDHRAASPGFTRLSSSNPEAKGWNSGFLRRVKREPLSSAPTSRAEES